METQRMDSFEAGLANSTDYVEWDWDAEDEDSGGGARDMDGASFEGDASPEGESLRVKYNGEEMDLPRDEAVALAQKGMNYDKVLARAERAEAALLGGAGGPAGEDELAGFIELVGKYPGVQELPPEAAALVRRGVPPLYAYEAWENTRLKAALAARDADRHNRATTPGSAESLGETASSDPFLAGFGT